MIAASRAEAEAERDERKQKLLRKLKGQAPAGMSAKDLWSSLVDIGDVGHVLTLLRELAEQTPPAVSCEGELWYHGPNPSKGRAGLRFVAVEPAKLDDSCAKTPEPLAPRTKGGNVATPQTYPASMTAVEVRRMQVLELLQQHPEGMSSAEVIRALGTPQSTTYNDLMKLQSRDLARQDHNGKWRAVATDTTAPQSCGEPSAPSTGTQAEPGSGAGERVTPPLAGGDTAQSTPGEGVDVDALARASAPGPERQPEHEAATASPAPQPHHSPPAGSLAEDRICPPADALAGGEGPQGSGSAEEPELQPRPSADIDDEPMTLSALRMRTRFIRRLALDIERGFDEAVGDALGSALSRIGELERENQELRARLERIAAEARGDR